MSSRTEKESSRLSVRLGLKSRQSKIGRMMIATLAYMILMSFLVKIGGKESSVGDKESGDQLQHSSTKSSGRQSTVGLKPSNLGLDFFEQQKRFREESLKDLSSGLQEEILLGSQRAPLQSAKSVFQARNLLQSGDHESKVEWRKRRAEEEKRSHESPREKRTAGKKAEGLEGNIGKEPTEGTPSTTTTTTTTSSPATTTTTTSTTIETTTANEGPLVISIGPDNVTTECTRAAVEQFPKPLMSQHTRASGGLILHIFAALYLFVAIAIVCDEFFVPSLEVICDRLEVSEDVAGATFMAAGSSAPELATALIAVFIAEDDIGISGVIGSAVFNIMFVISVCALFAETEVNINWWPVVRDCVCYCISICALLLTIVNEVVRWYEALFLLVLYVGYCVMMSHNKRLEVWANTLNVPFKNVPTREEKGSLFGAKSPPVQPGQDANKPQDGEQAENGMAETADPTVPKQAPVQEVDASPPRMMAPKMKDEDESPWDVPLGVWERFYWGFTLPLVALHFVTVPDCRRRKWERWFLLTFFMSMVWISIYSYIMVWMITIIGFTMGIPDTVMGLTLIAVGVSVPDAVSSLCVVKQGFGDMAVSNAIGSNVFDILLCLGLPWFLKTGIVDPGSEVQVASRGLTYSTLSLFSTVVFLIGAMHCNGWRLDKKLGAMLLVWYFFFMIFASLYEMNVFGDFNPKTCKSDY